MSELEQELELELLQRLEVVLASSRLPDYELLSSVVERVQQLQDRLTWTS